MSPSSLLSFPRRCGRRLWDQYSWLIESGYPIPLTVLSLYRIALAAYMLALNAIPDLRWIASYPELFYDPPSGMPAIWGGFLPYWALVALELGLILAICGLLVGWRTPFMSVAVTVVGYAANSAYFSFGKIDHTFMLWIVPGLLAFSGWGRFYSVDASWIPGRSTRRRSFATAPSAEPWERQTDDVQGSDGPRSGGRQAEIREMAPAWPVAAIGVLLAMSFLTAAVPKILKGWLSFDTSAVKRHVDRSFQLDGDQLLAEALLDFDFQPFWEALDWGAVGLEVALSVGFLWPLAQRWLIFAVWIFHLANLVLLNIGFYGPLAVYPLFFLPLVSPEAGARVGEALMRRWRLAAAAVPVLALVAFFGQGLWWTVTREVMGLSPLWSDLTFFAFGFVVLIAVAVLTKGYRKVIMT
ncbi:MAG: hypothetical protein ACR2QO_00110 [Acidimicrobiales bacterium]